MCVYAHAHACVCCVHVCDGNWCVSAEALGLCQELASMALPLFSMRHNVSLSSRAHAKTSLTSQLALWIPVSAKEGWDCEQATAHLHEFWEFEFWLSCLCGE